MNTFKITIPLLALSLLLSDLSLSAQIQGYSCPTSITQYSNGSIKVCFADTSIYNIRFGGISYETIIFNGNTYHHGESNAIAENNLCQWYSDNANDLLKTGETLEGYPEVGITNYIVYDVGSLNCIPNCPGIVTLSLPALPASSYQWQINTGSGFTSINNNGVYTGATTKMLSISGATTLPNTQNYRCLIDNSYYSINYTLSTTNVWLGTTDNAWETPTNWSCGNVPDATTNVIILAGKPRYPTVNTDAIVKSIFIENNAAAIIVKQNQHLTIVGDGQ